MEWSNGGNGDQMAEWSNGRNAGMVEWLPNGGMVKWREWLPTYYFMYMPTTTTTRTTLLNLLIYLMVAHKDFSVTHESDVEKLQLSPFEFCLEAHNFI